MVLFKSKRQRQLEADIQVRQSKARIRRFIRNARQVQKRYWTLGKQSLRLGDREQFTQLAGAFVRTRQQGNQWERYLLQLETLSVRHDEVAATGDFIKGISTMTNSILRGVNPEKIAAMQERMGQALAKAEALEEVLAVAMESSAETVFASDELDEEQMEHLAEQMSSEAEAEEGAAYDERIAKGLEQIEAEMRKEL